MITTYTFPYNKIQNRILVNACIDEPNKTINTSCIYKALWDTGATITCISEELVQVLGLKRVDQITITGANNKPFPANVYCVQLQLGKYPIEHHLVVALPMQNTGHDLIIGMDIITQGDLSITNYEGKTVITFRTPSLEKIDYTQELSEYKKYLAEYNAKVRAHIKPENIKCGCQSGKIFKNCHGKSIYGK